MGHEIIDIKKKNHLKSWSLSKNSVVPLTLNYISECRVNYPHGITRNLNIEGKKSDLRFLYILYWNLTKVFMVVI